MLRDFSAAPLFHPATYMLAWLCSILLVQGLDWVGLLVLLAAVFVMRPRAFPAWLKSLRRTFWLLLSLWLIVAYHQPGDAWLDIAWLPTEQGMREAWLQTARLATMLASLVWLHAFLNGEQLLLAWWFFLRPLKWVGINAERLVVRLALVMKNLQAPQAENWRENLLSGLSQAPNLAKHKEPLPAYSVQTERRDSQANTLHHAAGGNDCRRDIGCDNKPDGHGEGEQDGNKGGEKSAVIGVGEVGEQITLPLTVWRWPDGLLALLLVALMAWRWFLYPPFAAAM